MHDLKNVSKVCEYFLAQSRKSEYLMQFRNVGIHRDCCFCLRGCMKGSSNVEDKAMNEMFV